MLRFIKNIVLPKGMLLNYKYLSNLFYFENIKTNIIRKDILSLKVWLDLYNDGPFALRNTCLLFFVDHKSEIDGIFTPLQPVSFKNLL